MAPSAAFLQLTAFPKACVSIHVFLHSECSTSQGALGVICSYNLKGPTKHTILMLPPQTHEASLSKLTSWLPALAELSSIESHMWWWAHGWPPLPHHFRAIPLNLEQQPSRADQQRGNCLVD